MILAFWQLAKHRYHRDLHPSAILTSIIVLSAIGETINIMTLGGLALAVGILVDDATVEVENINRNREAEPEKGQWTKLSWTARRK